MLPITKTAIALTLAAATTSTGAEAEQPAQAKDLVVRIAELEIDPAQLDAYKAALAEEVEASVRLEPGVLALNAVSIADDPTHIRLLEVYASQDAYEAHLKSPHFTKYKISTADMVQSLKLVSTTPIKLCSKAMQYPASTAQCI